MSGSRPAEGSWLDGLWAAVGFLTVLPVPEDAATRGRSRATAFFPWVGGALGLVTAGVAAIPAHPFVASSLALGLLMVLTGGLHWDAWGDVLDASVTPGIPRARRLAILDDSRAGTHAVVGIALLVGLAVWGLSRAPSWGIVIGSVLGRWGMVATLRWIRPLGDTGAAARLRGEARPVAAALAPLSVGGAVLGLRLADPGTVLLATGVGVGSGALLAVALAARLGGLNGDGHGAAGLVTEVCVWVLTAELAGGVG